MKLNLRTKTAVSILFSILLLGCGQRNKVANSEKEGLSTYSTEYLPFDFPSINMRCPIPWIMRTAVMEYYGNGDTSGSYKSYYFWNDNDLKPFGKEHTEYDRLEVNILLIKPISSRSSNYMVIFNQKIEFGKQFLKQTIPNYPCQIINDTSILQGAAMPIIIRISKARMADTTTMGSDVLRTFSFVKIGNYGITFDYCLRTNDTSIIPKRKDEMIYCLHHLSIFKP